MAQICNKCSSQVGKSFAFMPFGLCIREAVVRSLNSQGLRGEPWLKFFNGSSQSEIASPSMQEQYCVAHFHSVHACCFHMTTTGVTSIRSEMV